MQLQRKKDLFLKARLKFNPAILKLNRECFTVPLQDIKQQSLEIHGVLICKDVKRVINNPKPAYL